MLLIFKLFEALTKKIFLKMRNRWGKIGRKGEGRFHKRL